MGFRSWKRRRRKWPSKPTASKVKVGGASTPSFRIGIEDDVRAVFHAYAPERLPPLGKPQLRALWKQAADLGLGVQLHFEPRHAAGFEPLVKEFARTTVIVDHLGRPFQGKPEEHARVGVDPGAGDLQQLLRAGLGDALGEFAGLGLLFR
jgi:hypothetical protein